MYLYKTENFRIIPHFSIYFMIYLSSGTKLRVSVWPIDCPELKLSFGTIQTYCI